MRTFLLNEINKYDSYGINLLSAILKKEGHESRVFLVPDLIENTTITMHWLKNFKPAFHVSDEDYVDYILSFNPQVVGFSIVTTYWNRSSKLAQIFKRKNPEVITVAGGPHTTVSLHREMLEETGFDYIVKGDGEIALPKLVDALESKNYEPNIPGVYYLRDGEMCGTGMGELIELDTMPFQDKSDVFRDYPYMQRLYVVNSQRSCQFSCTYCGSPSYRDAYYEEDETIFRRRSVDNLIRELQEATARLPLIRHIMFDDDAFFLRSVSDIEDFSKKYKEHIGKPLIITGATPSTLTKEKLSLLVDAGLVEMRMGIQTAGTSTKKLYKRPHTNQQVENAVRMVHSHKKIKGKYDIILDSPWDTDEDSIETLMFLSKLPTPFQLTLFSLVFFPGTELYRKAKKEGIIKDDLNDVYRKHYHGCKKTYMNGLFLLLNKYAFVGVGIAPKIMFFLTHKKTRQLQLHRPLFMIIKILYPLFKIKHLVQVKGLRRTLDQIKTTLLNKSPELSIN